MRDPIEVGCTHDDDGTAVVVFIVDPAQFNDNWESVLNVKMSADAARKVALAIFDSIDGVEELRGV